MSQTRLEIRVGAFVLTGLVLLGVLMLLFSKGATFFGSSFELRLRSGNVGGIKTGANVLVSGVPVGRVSGVKLDPDGKAVTIFLRISKRYALHDDAKFEVEQFGFLGDQYVSIYPGDNQGRQLKDGDEVQCRNPFNMQEAVAKATETISHIGQAATNVNQAIADVRRLVLTEETLKNLGVSIDRFALLTSDAMNAVSNVNVLVASNALPVTVAVSNLNYFSGQLTPLTAHVTALITNNEADIAAAIKNIENASGLLTNLLHDLQTRQGVAGRLLHDEEMAANFSAIVQNLSVTTSNLNRAGLWSILWKQKSPRTNRPSAKVMSAPHDPFN
ncbi:MAG: MlaD family protein [Verrucomicrobia bacterium]|jgi:phospholipid/cholesterol/gamma-HCH transport system substrate-binding protein|nr:MlaD family protein [Verrucomicrobiota bacterium]